MIFKLTNKKNISKIILKCVKSCNLLTFLKKKNQYLALVKSSNILKQLKNVNRKNLTFFDLKIVLVLKYYKGIVKYLASFSLFFTLLNKRFFWNLFLFNFFKESLSLLQFFKKIKKRKNLFFFNKNFVSLVRTHSDFNSNLVTNYYNNLNRIKPNFYIKKYIESKKSLNIYTILAKKNNFILYLKKKNKNNFFSIFKYIKICFLFKKQVFTINDKFSMLYASKYNLYLSRKPSNLLLFVATFIKSICSHLDVFYLTVKKKPKHIFINFLIDSLYLQKCSFFFFFTNWCLSFVNIKFRNLGIVSKFLKINDISRLSFLFKKQKSFNFYFKNKRIVLIYYGKKKKQQQFLISNNITKTKSLLKSKVLVRIISSYYVNKNVFNIFKFTRVYSVKKKVYTLLKIKLKNFKRILRICNKTYYKQLFFKWKK